MSYWINIVLMACQTVIAVAWMGLIGDDRMLSVDGKYLLRYCASQRKANPLAVHKLAGERQQKAIDEGREITPALMEEFLFQAESEVIKYAPVTTVSVFLLIWPSKRLLLASGSTAAKCEEALSMLRKTLGSLSSYPWDCVPPFLKLLPM
ncbi:hypothetical protein HPG84_24215 (plasmid) [Salmonella enterica]|nr:hypothetical protein HPG84_24215 [Salmonella enterica]